MGLSINCDLYSKKKKNEVIARVCIVFVLNYVQKNL